MDNSNKKSNETLKTAIKNLRMKPIPIILIGTAVTFSFTACSQTGSTNKPIANTRMDKKIYTAGKDYIQLKRFRLIDKQGFNQPVEAISLMLPANWQTNGNIQWNGTSKCMPEILQASLQASSPEGDYELMMLPATQFDWSDDELTLDAMRRGGFVYSCRLQQPKDADTYIKDELAPYIKSTAASVQRPAALNKLMQQGAMQMKQAAMQAGNSAYNYNPSAAEAKLIFADGKEGIAIVTLMQTIVTMPGAFGQQIKTYQCYVSMRIVLKHPKGKEAAARQLLGILLSNTRVNPEWGAAVQTTFQAIQQGAQNTLGQIIQITTQTQSEISNNITRKWEKAGNSDNNTKAWSEYIRGVDNWTEAGGNKVELTAGYSNGWSKSDGSYILTNDVSFDPNIAFGETWAQMKK
jgi:hypothetical protein